MPAARHYHLAKRLYTEYTRPAAVFALLHCLLVDTWSYAEPCVSLACLQWTLAAAATAAAAAAAHQQQQQQIKSTSAAQKPSGKNIQNATAVNQSQPTSRSSTPQAFCNARQAEKWIPESKSSVMISW